MPQPYDYRLNIPDPTQVVMSGLQVGEAVNQLKAKRQASDQAAAQNAQLQQDLGYLYDDPSPANVARMMAKYPQLSEQFKRTYDVLDREDQKTRLSQASEVYAALASGENEIAQDLLTQQAEAYANSGMEKEAKTLNDLAKLVELNPEVAKTSTGLFLAAAMGPEKFTENFTRLEADRRMTQLEEADLTEKEAKAYQAAVAADFAESNAVADLQKKGWDITKLQTDAEVARENARIAAMEAELKREQNQLKRDELALKVAERRHELDEKVREKTAEIEGVRAGVDNSLNTIDRLLKNPELPNVVGSLEGSAFYPSTLIGMLNPLADSDRRADAIADIETVAGQQFLDNLIAAKNMGATFGSLDKNEGVKLEGYIASLKTKQSEGQFIDNLRNIQRLLLKSRENLAKKYGVPNTLPDRPAAEQAPLPEAQQRYRMVRDTGTGELFPMPISDSEVPVIEEAPNYSQYQEGQILESRPRSQYQDSDFQIIGFEE